MFAQCALSHFYRAKRRTFTQRPPYGVGREGEGAAAGDVRSGRQRREERLGLVNESWDFYRFKAPTATFTALNKV